MWILPRCSLGCLYFVLVPGGHGEHHREPQLSALRDVLEACLRGEPPKGVDPTTTFDRSFTLGSDALIRDDGSRVPIVGVASHGSIQVVQATQRMARVAGSVGPGAESPPELVVFVDGTYAGRGTALVQSGTFNFRFPRTARRSVRVFVLDEAGGAGELPYTSAGWKLAIRLRVWPVLRRGRAVARIATRRVRRVASRPGAT